jgi:predicted phosphodiesterase
VGSIRADAARLPRVRSFLDEHDGIFLGHTHIQPGAVIDDRLILNLGSVGQSCTRTDAEYSIVGAETSGFQLHATQYSMQRVMQAIKKTGLPMGAAERLEP